MAAADWLRGRPDARHGLLPRPDGCPTATLDELLELGRARVVLLRRVGALPVRARLPRRRGGAVPRPRDGERGRPGRTRRRGVPARPARHAGAHVPRRVGRRAGGDGGDARPIPRCWPRSPTASATSARPTASTRSCASPATTRSGCARRRRSRSPAAPASAPLGALIALSPRRVERRARLGDVRARHARAPQDTAGAARRARRAARRSRPGDAAGGRPRPRRARRHRAPSSPRWSCSRRAAAEDGGTPPLLGAAWSCARRPSGSPRRRGDERFEPYLPKARGRAAEPGAARGRSAGPERSARGWPWEARPEPGAASAAVGLDRAARRPAEPGRPGCRAGRPAACRAGPRRRRGPARTGGVVGGIVDRGRASRVLVVGGPPPCCSPGRRARRGRGLVRGLGLGGAGSTGGVGGLGRRRGLDRRGGSRASRRGRTGSAGVAGSAGGASDSTGAGRAFGGVGHAGRLVVCSAPSARRRGGAGDVGLGRVGARRPISTAVGTPSPSGSSSPSRVPSSFESLSLAAERRRNSTMFVTPSPSASALASSALGFEPVLRAS